ncbi:MAG: hypothetical protein D6775_15830, partial [Caldilineae bacterium]
MRRMRIRQGGRPWGGWVLSLLLILAVLTALFPLTPVRPSLSASATWVDLQGPRGGPAQAIALSPAFATDALVFAGGGRDYVKGAWAGQGIFRSSDGGATWSARLGPGNGAVFDIAFSPNWSQDGHAVAGLWQGVWATTDGGASWQEVSSFGNGGLGMVASIDISPGFAVDHTYLASGSYGAIFRSTDAGASWTSVGPTSTVYRVVFHPGTGAIALAAAADGLWRSTDGGAGWTQVITGTAIADVTFRPLHDTAYASAPTQVLRSTDGGATWHPFGSGLSASH